MKFPRRWPAFSLSLAGHIALVLFLAWMDSALQPEAPAVKFTVVMVPKEPAPRDKVIWYDAHVPTPEITPEQPFGPSDKPTGQKDPSGRILIAVSPSPASTTQLIRQPQPEPLPVDVPTPNLVVLSSLQPAPKATPKPFVAPTPTPRTTVSTATTFLEPAPVADAPKVPANNALGAIVSMAKLPPKAFVAPTRGSGAGSKPSPEVALPEPPAIGTSASPGAGAEVVIVGLNPAAGIVPPGSRSAQFAKAPDAGPPSSGSTRAPGAPTVPNLMAHGNTGQPLDTAPAPSAKAPERRALKEIEFAQVSRTMSAPLRPSSRIIPASVEAQFANRNVYTLVIPGPNLPEYPGDWVMWFAERQIDNDTGLRILAPMPARKYSLQDADPPPLAPPSTATVQLAAIIDRNGRIASARILRSTAAGAFRLLAVAEFETWEFKPALRNGEPVDVDVVVEIPMQLRLPSQASQ